MSDATTHEQVMGLLADLAQWEANRAAIARLSRTRTLCRLAIRRAGTPWGRVLSDALHLASSGWRWDGETPRLVGRRLLVRREVTAGA